MGFSFGWRTGEDDGEGQNEQTVLDVSICPSLPSLHSTPPCSALGSRPAWIIIAESSDFQLGLAMGKASSRDQREEGGGGWDIYFSGSPLAGLLWVNYVHQAKVTGPLQFALSIQLFAFGFVNTSSLYSYVPRNVTGPQSYLWNIELYFVVFLHKIYHCK